MFETTVTQKIGTIDDKTDSKTERLGEYEIIRNHGMGSVPPQYVEQAIDALLQRGCIERLYAEAESARTSNKRYGAAIYDNFRINGTDGTPPYEMRVFLSIGDGNGGKGMGWLRCDHQNSDGSRINVDLARFENIPPSDS